MWVGQFSPDGSVTYFSQLANHPKISSFVNLKYFFGLTFNLELNLFVGIAPGNNNAPGNNKWKDNALQCLLYRFITIYMLYLTAFDISDFIVLKAWKAIPLENLVLIVLVFCWCWLLAWFWLTWNFCFCFLFGSLLAVLSDDWQEDLRTAEVPKLRNYVILLTNVWNNCKIAN